MKNKNVHGKKRSIRLSMTNNANVNTTKNKSFYRKENNEKIVHFRIDAERK